MITINRIREQEKRVVLFLDNLEKHLIRMMGERKQPVLLSHAEILDGMPVQTLVFEGVVIGRTSDDESGYNKLQYYHVPIRDSVPIKREERKDGIQFLASKIAEMAIESGLPIDATIRAIIGRMLAYHPFAFIVMHNAKIKAEEDRRYLLGWPLAEDLERFKEKLVCRKNVIVIKGYECPASEDYVKNLRERLPDLLDMGIAVMLLEEDEKTRGIGMRFGATPVTIICDEYFRVEKILLGSISIAELLEVSR